jgi:hypothetical protein
MKLSTTKTLCDGPTLRQKAAGMPGGSIRRYSTLPRPTWSRSLDHDHLFFGTNGAPIRRLHAVYNPWQRTLQRLAIRRRKPYAGSVYG